MRPSGVAVAIVLTAMMLGSMSTSVTADDPFVESNHYQGYLACSVATPGVSAAACALSAGTPVDTFDSFLFRFEVATGIQELVVGLQWTPSTPAGTNLSVRLEDNGCGFASCPYLYGEEDSASPIVFRITDDDISDPAFLWSNIEDTRIVQVRVFAGGDASLFVDQNYDLYVHEFYHQTAPEGFDPFPSA